MTQILPCAKCKREIDWIGNSLEVSHNIPKYMGGTDKDGRKLLCPGCHIDYEYEVLSKCLKQFFDISLPRFEDKRDYIHFYNIIRNSSESLKKGCRDLAKQICDDFFGGKND